MCSNILGIYFSLYFLHLPFITQLRDGKKTEAKVYGISYLVYLFWEVSSLDLYFKSLPLQINPMIPPH
ncbi:hypothetical protein FB379_12552 [Aeribacillus composti]|nr:hypothetical protein FB379_12552 [Aeribacillus composti]